MFYTIFDRFQLPSFTRTYGQYGQGFVRLFCSLFVRLFCMLLMYFSWQCIAVELYGSGALGRYLALEDMLAHRLSEKALIVEL